MIEQHPLQVILMSATFALLIIQLINNKSVDASMGWYAIGWLVFMQIQAAPFLFKFLGVVFLKWD